MSLTPYGAEIERANRRHRMDERNRIRRMMEAASDAMCNVWMSEMQAGRIERLIEHCQAELDILNAELGL